MAKLRSVEIPGGGNEPHATIVQKASMEANFGASEEARQFFNKGLSADQIRFRNEVASRVNGTLAIEVVDTERQIAITRGLYDAVMRNQNAPRPTRSFADEVGGRSATESLEVKMIDTDAIPEIDPSVLAAAWKRQQRQMSA